MRQTQETHAGVFTVKVTEGTENKALNFLAQRKCAQADEIIGVKRRARKRDGEAVRITVKLYESR
jgi:hypothetical protein